MVSINFLYCRSLCPAARIASGEMSATLSLAPNDDNRVVDLTQLSMSSDSMMSNWEGSVGNPFRSARKMTGGLRETASEALCHFPGQCWMVNLYLRFFSFSLNNRGFELLRCLMNICVAKCVGSREMVGDLSKYSFIVCLGDFN